MTFMITMIIEMKPVQKPMSQRMIHMTKVCIVRGLRLEHDSTFEASSENTKCDETGERCLYSYAKILDSGLYKRSDPEDDSSDFVAITPVNPQVDVDGVGLDESSISTRELRCLPDSFNYTELSDKSWRVNHNDVC